MEDQTRVAVGLGDDNECGLRHADAVSQRLRDVVPVDNILGQGVSRVKVGKVMRSAVALYSASRAVGLIGRHRATRR